MSPPENTTLCSATLTRTGASKRTPAGSWVKGNLVDVLTTCLPSAAVSEERTTVTTVITADLTATITEALPTMALHPTTTALPSAVAPLVLAAPLGLPATMIPVTRAPDPPVAALALLVTTMIATRAALVHPNAEALAAQAATRVITESLKRVAHNIRN